MRNQLAFRSKRPPSTPADLLLAVRFRRDLQELLPGWSIEGRDAAVGEEWHCHNPATDQDLYILEWGRYPSRFVVSLGDGRPSREFPSWEDALQYLRDTIPGLA